MNRFLTTLAAAPIASPDGGKDKNLDTQITSIINNVIYVLGIVAVVVMIIGGIMYMTSGGEATKVKNAKNTLLYGAIGLVVVALSYALVNWVLSGILGQAI